MIHETCEQFEKAKTPSPDKDRDTKKKAIRNHSSEILAENMVNENVRREDTNGGFSTYAEKDGTTTKQVLTPTESGGINVYKTKVE